MDVTVNWDLVKEGNMCLSNALKQHAKHYEEKDGKNRKAP